MALAYKIVRFTIFSSTFFALVGFAALLTMNELDRLINDVVAPSGHVHAISSVIGFSAAAEIEAWADWRLTSPTFDVLALVRAHGLLDLLFIGAYVGLGIRLILRAKTLHAHAGTPNSSARWSVILLSSLAGADLAEDALVVVLSCVDITWLSYVLAVVTYLKWAATLFFALHLLFGNFLGVAVGPFLSNAVRAVYAQRLAVVVVGAVALVSLTNRDGVLEQVPDAYRGWITYPSETESGAVGLELAPLWAAIAFAITGLGLFALGRHRARQYARTTVPDNRVPAALLPWVFFALVIAVVAIAVAAFTDGDSIDWMRLLLFLVIALAIAGGSWLVTQFSPPTGGTLIAESVAGYAVSARRTGDLLVAIWLIVGTFGPFKALIAPLVLNLYGTFDYSEFKNSFVTILLIAISYLVGGMAAVIGYRWIIGSLTPADALANPVAPTISNPRAVVKGLLAPVAADLPAGVHYVFRGILACAALTLLAFLLFPLPLAHAFGPIAVLVALIGAWATLVGGLILVLGRRQPLPIFRKLRLRSAPIVTLLVILPILTSYVDGAAGMHAVRMATPEPSPERVSLDVAFGQWYDSDDTCTQDLGGQRVKPLVLVAAEGGGIRAATWTVDVLRQFARAGSCAAHSVFLSSGASGGSVGLASFQLPGNDVAISEADLADLGDHGTVLLGGPGALSADLAGLLAGDLVGGLTGVRVPSPSTLSPTSEWQWHDRTALQEITWEQALPVFSEAFDADPQPPTGFLVLNSTDSISNCKVLVSQLELSAAGEHDGTGANAPQCNGKNAELANAIDLLDYLGACKNGLSWATAAELSARFPFVSPAGRISNETLPDGCSEVYDMQLVDGGVTDNSALGTISDLAPALSQLIRAKNHVALENNEPLVVPIVLFASNEPGADVLREPDGTRPEVLIPPAVLLSAKSALVTPSSWLTRVTAGLANICPEETENSGCSDAAAALHVSLPENIAVAAPPTSPAISVPLGWTLSSFSRSQLRFQSDQQARCGRDTGENQLEPDNQDCNPAGDYADLGQLLNLID